MKNTLVKFLFASLFLSWMNGCAISSKQNGSNSGSSASGQNNNGGDPSSVDSLNSFHLSDSQSPEVVDQELEIIPTEVNPMVEKWITYFQGRGHDHMERYLSRSTRYEKLMKKVLRNNGVPEDLFYIALIESGFTARATSHASAVGYWQFIRGTGKRYGLEISRFVDERRDPVMATQAAAEYFKGLYSVFGSWYLAMASYNVGENRVKREVMQNTTRDFWELAKKSRLPKETINYVPKFIAAKLIAKNPAKYGFEDIDYMPPVEFDTIAVKSSVNLRAMAEKLETNYEDFKAINPKFKGEIAPLRGEFLNLRVPPGLKEQGLIAAAASTVDRVEYVADRGETETIRIRPGDNLSLIARRYRTTVAYLRDLNDIPRGKKLRIGMKMVVPDRTPIVRRVTRSAKVASNPKAPASSTESLSSENGSSKFYIVQNGDSLFSIAQRYNTTVAELKKLNNIRRGRMIKIGLKLKLPGDVSGTDGQMETRKNSQDSGRRHIKPRVHIVRRGDNLHKIASRYDVSIRAIKARNKIHRVSKILVGERLLIPRAVASQ